jgi:hypothetical protein
MTIILGLIHFLQLHNVSVSESVLDIRCKGGEVSTHLGMLEITSLSYSDKLSLVGTLPPSHLMMEIDPFFQSDAFKETQDDVSRIIVMPIVRNLKI